MNRLALACFFFFFFFFCCVYFFPNSGADMQLLPSSFRALEADLGLSPTTLAASSLMQTLTCTWTRKTGQQFGHLWVVISPNLIRDWPPRLLLRCYLLSILGRDLGQWHSDPSTSALWWLQRLGSYHASVGQHQ